MGLSYDNLFLDAMDTDQKRAIDDTKANKHFALQLINDLDKVFQTNYQIEDLENGVSIKMRTSPSSNMYGAFSFFADKNGIKFCSKNLGYYKCNQFKDLGWLYEKYKDNGTAADSGFLSERNGHGFVQFVIPINRNSNNLKDALKDIMYLMEQDSYRKRF